MPRAARVLLSGLAFLLFAVGGAALSWVILPLSVARHRGRLAQRRRSQAVLHRYGYGGFVGTLRWLRLIAFDPPPVALPDGAYVLVANHPSLVDVMLLLATFPGLACVVKRSWFASPLIGPLLRHGGYIAGPGRDEDEAGEGPAASGPPVLQRIVACLREGTPVLIFPEGSRSPPDGLLRFKRGAAEAALRAGVPLVPVLLRYDPPTLARGGSGGSWWRVPARAIRISLEPLVDRAGDEPLPPDADARAVTHALRVRYERALGLESGPSASGKLASRGPGGSRLARSLVDPSGSGVTTRP